MSTLPPASEQDAPKAKHRSLWYRLYNALPNVDFVGRWKTWYGVSAIILLVCIGSLFFRGLNLGIEFRGGADFSIPNATCTVEQARAVAEPATGAQAIVTETGSGTIRVPTEAVTLTTGKPGFRVAVDGISSPWTFAVATPKAGALEVTPEMKDAIHRDQLYWTDREAWQREAVDWYKARPLTTFPAGARVSLRAAPGPTGEFERIRVQVLDTYQLFALAGAGMTADLTVPLGLAPIPGIEATAQGLWAVGVAQLARTRDDWLAFRATLGEIESLAPDVAVAIGFMDQWIETASHLYTP